MSNRIFDYAKRLISYDSDVNMVKRVNNLDVKQPDLALLDLIFGIDPTTGLPVGDLSVYLGDKANPEVKFFIESQLLQERKDINGVSNLATEVTNQFKTLTDDDIVKFTRNHNESREEYANRLRLYFADERAKRAQEKKDAEFKRLVEQVNGKS